MHRRLSDFLEYDRDRPLLPIIVGDGERYALSVLIDAHDDELAGPRLACHHRRGDDHQLVDIAECFLVQYLVHRQPPFPFIVLIWAKDTPMRWYSQVASVFTAP